MFDSVISISTHTSSADHLEKGTKGRYTGEVFPSPKDVGNQVGIRILPLLAMGAGLSDAPL